MTDVALLPIRTENIRRVLVLRPRALGDVLLATPAFRALHQGLPHAEVHAAVDDTLLPVLQRNPHLHRVWGLPRRTGGARPWARLYREVARARFDLVVDLHGSPRTAWIAFWSRAPHRVGYRLRGRGRLYNHRLPRDANRRGERQMLYAAQTNLEIVARLGVTGPWLRDTRLVFEVEPGASQRAVAFFDTAMPHRPRAGLVPATTWPAKTAPPELFAAVGDRLARRGVSVLLLWGPGELEVTRQVMSQMQEQAVLAPHTDLDELAALVAGLDVVVAHDSGVKHLATALGTPTVTLFGPTDPRAWLPPAGPHRGVRAALPCLGCNFTRCTHRLCMRELDAESIVAAALGLVHEVGVR